MTRKPRTKSARTPARMDIRDVAARAKVSISTVSRAMNGVSSVNPKMAAAVWRAAEELGYTPNTLARALVSGRSRILGLIVSEITNPFFPELIQRFEEAAVASGYDVLIASTNHEAQRTAQCIRRMISRNVDGVAVMTFGLEGMHVRELSMRNVPMVFIDEGPALPNVETLHVDYRRGIRQGVQHLAALGHRRIAFVSGPLHATSARARQEAFCLALGEIGLATPLGFLAEGGHTLEGGQAAMSELLDLPNPPTAVICSNDLSAIGVLHGVAERRLRVPDDLSVIGFDDVHIAQFTLPPLTTIRMACIDIAQGAVSALRHKLEPATQPPAAVAPITTNLVVRRTTSYPRGAMDDLIASPS
ncbi:MAG: LacI family DNA-binding transcriptional regulator [Acidobacteriaceae bacterium]